MNKLAKLRRHASRVFFASNSFGPIHFILKYFMLYTRDSRPAPKKEALPRPMKITKTCKAQRGKVDFNSLIFGRQ